MYIKRVSARIEFWGAFPIQYIFLFSILFFVKLEPGGKVCWMLLTHPETQLLHENKDQKTGTSRN